MAVHAVHDALVIDFLDRCEKSPFSGTVYRVTPKKTNPLAPSLRGGRWMLANTTAVLYTSCIEDGAMAEVAYNYSRVDPSPVGDVHLHEIRVSTKKTARIPAAALKEIGLDMATLELNLAATQRIGAAAAFLEYDGILVPSFRWKTDNLVIFSDIHGFDSELNLVRTKDVNWKEWRDGLRSE